MGSPVANATGNIYYSVLDGNTDLLYTGSQQFDEQVISQVASSAVIVGIDEKGPAKSSSVGRLTITLDSERVTNPGFTGNDVGWTSDDTYWAYGSGNEVASPGGVGQLEQDVLSVSGETYEITVVMSAYTAGTWYVEVGGVAGYIHSRAGTITEHITATGTGNLKIVKSSDGDFTLDNVSAKKVAKNVLASRVISADLSTRDGLILWLRCSVTAQIGELQLLLDDTALCASPLETLNLPALQANLWHRVLVRFNNPEDDTAIISIGINRVITTINSNLGAYTLDIFQPRLMDEFEGRKSFSITENVEVLDASDYQSKTSRQYKDSFSTWTASMEGHKEGAPPLIKNQQYVFAFAESDTVGQAFVGEGEYTGFTPAGNFADLVQYPYNIQGTKYLCRPSN